MAKFAGDFESASFEFDDVVAFKHSFERMAAHDPLLAEFVSREIQMAADDPDSNVLCVGTDGELTVTIVLVPQMMIGNEVGPVLLPTADRTHIVAAASLEVVARRAETCLNTAESSNGRADWNAMVNWFFDRAVELAQNGRRPEVPEMAREA